MKKYVASSVAVLALSAGVGLAEPRPRPTFPNWDYAAGAGVVSDYLFRGVSQSARDPSFNAYFEPRLNLNPDLQLYAGIAYNSIRFANGARSEIDFYGGVRPTFGKLTLDVGFWYYYYPSGTCFNSAVAGCSPTLANGNIIKADVSFWEVYFKPSYAFSDAFAIGGNLAYSPDFLNTGANGTFASVTAKYTFPAWPNGIAMYVSGELGYQWLGTSDAFYGNINYADYATWNVGVGFTWKVVTLDLRYTDTNLNKGDCNAFTSDHTATGVFTTPINPAPLPGSNWCNARFTARLSADITGASFK
ncbi:MAG TPA: TorF family putative porin [Xanthobacteraceae bacterium]|nr:TorF family putative porin [Xanthobacteraceae bacterium]